MTLIAIEGSENSSLLDIWVGWGGGCRIGRDCTRGTGRRYVCRTSVSISRGGNVGCPISLRPHGRHFNLVSQSRVGSIVLFLLTPSSAFPRYQLVIRLLDILPRGCSPD